MRTVSITGHGVFTPSQIITNDELVVAFNAFADAQNEEHAEEIAAGTVKAIAHSSADFITSASGINQRYVVDKEGVLDPTRMFPNLDPRPDDAPGQMAEMGIDAARTALKMAGTDAADVDLVICAASNHERAYPAVAIEIQQLLGAGGFAFDMNVACSSATFGLQAAADMIKSGSVSKALVICPEICSAHLEWRDRDCHFIFGDVATALWLEAEEGVSYLSLFVGCDLSVGKSFRIVVIFYVRHCLKSSIFVSYFGTVKIAFLPITNIICFWSKIKLFQKG